MRIDVTEGDMGKGYVSARNVISHIHKIKTCVNIAEELTKGWRG